MFGRVAGRSRNGSGRRATYRLAADPARLLRVSRETAVYGPAAWSLEGEGVTGTDLSGVVVFYVRGGLPTRPGNGTCFFAVLVPVVKS